MDYSIKLQSVPPLDDEVIMFIWSITTELIALPTPERMFQATINYAKPPASGQFKIW